MIENPTWDQLSTLSDIVYLITNTLNNRNYVGITMRTFKIRYCSRFWWKHISNKELKRDILKFGVENFKITILESNIVDSLVLNNKEDEYAIKYDAYWPKGYNIAKCGIQSNYLEAIRLGSRTKTYFLKNIESGEIVEVKNITNFCKEHNLNGPSLRAMIRGISNYSQGFTLPDRNIEDMFKWRIKLKTQYKIVTPNNEIIVVKDLRNFAKANNLDFYHLVEVLEQKKGHCSGFSSYENQIKFYEVIDPLDKIFKIRQGEINKFCEQYNLDVGNFCRMLDETPETKTHKGWRLLKNKDFKKEYYSNGKKRR